MFRCQENDSGYKGSMGVMVVFTYYNLRVNISISNHLLLYFSENKNITELK